MRWISALLLVACTAGYPPASAGSPNQDAGAQAEYLDLVPAIIEAIAPADRARGPLLVDVGSFVAAGETVFTREYSRTAVAAAIGRDFRDVPLQDAIVDHSQYQSRIVDNGVHIHLDSLQRRDGDYEAVVSKMNTRVDGPHSLINFVRVRFTFAYEDGRWILKKEQTLLVT